MHDGGGRKQHIQEKPDWTEWLWKGPVRVCYRGRISDIILTNGIQWFKTFFFIPMRIRSCIPGKMDGKGLHWCLSFCMNDLTGNGELIDCLWTELYVDVLGDCAQRNYFLFQFQAKYYQVLLLVSVP